MSNETSPESTPSAPPVSRFKPSWKLPDGIEDHIESGLVKVAVGVTLGGVAGMMLFKPGNGYRVASIMTGLGIALGSTYERYRDS